MNPKIVFVLVDPQPERHFDGWLFDGEFFITNETMQDHLFHNEYGKYGTPLGSVFGDGSSDSLIINNQKFNIFDVGVVFEHDLWFWRIEYEAEK